jgi:UDP-glucose 4-epimerase
MDYRGKKIAITGWRGFIGSHLVKALRDRVGDKGYVRDPQTFARLNHSYDYLFHFGAPSSQVLFKRNPAYCIEATMLGIINAGQAARDNGIRLVYPSTGLLSSDRYNEYAMGKKMSEDYVKGLNIDAVGIRIFATYGPGEGHKRDYASVPYLFARDHFEEITPLVFGNGEQTRDLIYIDDTIGGILNIAERASEDIVDLGNGQATSFNNILDMCTKVSGANLPRQYIGKPSGYVDDTLADTSVLHKYYVPHVSLREGIEGIFKDLKGGK